jgi:hypothetical protein
MQEDRPGEIIPPILGRACSGLAQMVGSGRVRPRPTKRKKESYVDRPNPFGLSPTQLAGPT